MKKPLLIFDLDGTLIDSKLDIANSINYIFKKFNLPNFSHQMIYPFIGYPLEVVMEKLLSQTYHHMIPEMGKMWREYYVHHWHEHTKPFPEVIETLKKLNNCYKAIATTKISLHTNKIAAKLGFKKYFDVIQGTDNFPAKPDPTIIHLIRKKFNVPLAQTLIIGDTDKDIEAGKHAGIKTCAVTYGIGKKEDLLVLKPDFIIGKFEEILNISAQLLA